MELLWNIYIFYLFICTIDEIHTPLLRFGDNGRHCQIFKKKNTARNHLAHCQNKSENCSYNHDQQRGDDIYV